MSKEIEVYKSIAKVAGELAKVGISKDQQNKQQGFKFRGIDDVYNTLAPILSKNNLCIIPRVLSRTVSEKTTKSGGALFYINLDVEFDLVSSMDGSMHTARVSGEAMDSGDKATNKAMSAAYKYLCFQIFCIPTEGDNDADSTTHEILSEQLTSDFFEKELDLHGTSASVEAYLKKNLKKIKTMELSEQKKLRAYADQMIELFDKTAEPIPGDLPT